MSEDDFNTGDLEEMRIDKQLAALRREVLQMGHTRTDSKENSKSARRIAEAFVIAALCGLGTTVWLLRETVATQQVSIAFLQKQMDRFESRTDKLDDRMNELSGRTMRGLQEGKDPYAPDKQ